MPDEKQNQPIEEPRPVDSAEVKSILWQIGNAVGVVACGATIFAMFFTPARAQGATRSGRLKWLEQQQTVQRDAAAYNQSTETNGVRTDEPHNR